MYYLSQLSALAVHHLPRSVYPERLSYAIATPQSKVFRRASPVEWPGVRVPASRVKEEKSVHQRKKTREVTNPRRRQDSIKKSERSSASESRGKAHPVCTVPGQPVQNPNTLTLPCRTSTSLHMWRSYKDQLGSGLRQGSLMILSTYWPQKALAEIFGDE